MQRECMAAAFGAAMLVAGAGSAFAQAGPGHTGSQTGSQPYSEAASNTSGQAVRPEVAPALPVPMVADNASAEAFLQAARTALARGQTGQAQEALERAQTRLLDRSVALFKTDQPSHNPAVSLISEALRALGIGNRAAAMQYIDQALPLTREAGQPR